MTILSPRTWPKWMWVAVFLAVVLPLIIGARQLGAWPFGGPEPDKISAPLPFAMQKDLADVSARVKLLSDASASKADVSELRAEIDELKAVVKSLSVGKGKRKVSTGSVR